MNVPTTEQSMRALTSANRVRTARKELKARLVLEEEDARDLLREVPPWLRTASLADFLTWIPKIGDVKAKKIAAKAIVSPSKSLSSLSARQVEEVCKMLPYYGGTRR